MYNTTISYHPIFFYKPEIFLVKPEPGEVATLNTVHAPLGNSIFGTTIKDDETSRLNDVNSIYHTMTQKYSIFCSDVFN